jgi:hypothetical protein
MSSWWGGFALASAAQQASVSAPVSNSHLFWYGILLGLLALFLPPWAKAVVFAVALIASGLFHTLGKAHASGSVPILLVVAIGVVVGLYFGRMRGLSQLGAAEYLTRWRNVRGVSRWL